MSMFAMRWLRRSALLAPLVLALAGPASANAEVGGFAPAGCASVPGHNTQTSWCLQSASGRGQGVDPYSFKRLVGTGMSYTSSDTGPPCGYGTNDGTDPTLTYFAVMPNHTAYAVVHFTGYRGYWP